MGMPAALWEGKSETDKRFACLYCDDEFSCPKERRVHVATVHCATVDTKNDPLKSPKVTMCIKCGLQLASLKDLRVCFVVEHLLIGIMLLPSLQSSESIISPSSYWRYLVC